MFTLGRWQWGTFGQIKWHGGMKSGQDILTAKLPAGQNPPSHIRHRTFAVESSPLNTAATANLRPLWREYLALCKPMIVSLMLITALAGMLLSASGLPDLATMLGGLVGIGLCSSAAAVVNHLLERKTDAQMARTRNRPMPTGAVPLRNAWMLAGILTVAGTAALLLFTNALCTLLTLCALLGYAAIYTAILKPATPYNIVIGGLPGAAPPLLGWVALTGQLDARPLMMTALIFVWTPAHFWALALARIEDYRKVGTPMLPVTHGEAYTRLQIVLYASLTLAASLMLFADGRSGLLYLTGATLLGVAFVGAALWLMLRPSVAESMRLFHFSNLYLLGLFALLIVDHMLLPNGPQLFDLQLAPGVGR